MTRAVDVDALEVQDLGVSYGGVVALDGVDLTVRRGEVVGLVGPNGAGKSSLVKAIMGLVPVRRGRVTVDGEDPRRDRRRVAHVPQHALPDPLFPAVVEEVVAMGRYPHLGMIRRPRQTDRDAVDEALVRTGLRPLRTRGMSALSGGQQRRVAIARALAQQAQYVILDEPYAGLDRPTQADLRTVLGALASDGVGILLVNHDLSVVAEDCDHVTLLRRTVQASGRPSEVLAPEVVAAAYGAPVPPADAQQGPA